MHLKSTEAYTFLTANRDKRKGPFLIHRDGVAIGHGYRTQKDAEDAVKRSVDQHARWVSPQDYTACKHESVDYQTYVCDACKKDLGNELF